MEARLEKIKEGDIIFQKLEELEPSVVKNDYYNSATGWDIFALRDDLRIALRDNLKDRNDLLKIPQDDVYHYAKALNCPLPPRASVQLAAHCLWEAISSNAPTTHGISLDAIMEMGEKRAEEAKKRQEAEDKRILGETATVEPEKEPAEDPNRLYP